MKNLKQCSCFAMFSLSVFMLICSSVAVSQTDLENALKQYDSETIKGYVQPLANLYGANINTGTFRSASIPLMGFTMSVDLIGMGSIVKDEYKTYTVTLPEGFTQRTTVQPTILGPAATLVTDPSGLQYKGSDGMVDASLFSHAIGQITIGSVNGTDAFFRFSTTPKIGGDKFPTTTILGGGVRHSISQYIPQAPLDIALGFSYNKMDIGDIMDISGITVGAQGSKNWGGAFTVYGGLGWEKSTLKLNYTLSGVNGTPVNAELDGDNNFRLTAGGLVKAGFFKIFADMNVGSVMNFSAGIGFGN